MAFIWILLHKCQIFFSVNKRLCEICTFQTNLEGSQYEGDETKRREALRLAMQLRANYIDVELEVSILSNKLRFQVQNVSIGKYHLILLFGSPEPPSLYCFADCS